MSRPDLRVLEMLDEDAARVRDAIVVQESEAQFVQESEEEIIKVQGVITNLTPACDLFADHVVIDPGNALKFALPPEIITQLEELKLVRLPKT